MLRAVKNFANSLKVVQGQRKWYCPKSWVRFTNIRIPYVLWPIFSRFDNYTNVTQTGTLQPVTARQHRSRLCIVSRSSKNWKHARTKQVDTNAFTGPPCLASWPLTFDLVTPKVDRFIPLTRGLLVSKSVHLSSKYRFHNFGNKRTNGNVKNAMPGGVIKTTFGQLCERIN